jgi:hypothetical protein
MGRLGDALVPHGSLGVFGGRMPSRVYEAPGAREGAPTAARAFEFTGPPMPGFVDNPKRVYMPGIYKDPRELAAEANAMVAPEHPSLKQLFGVTRDDLYQISQQGRRVGNVDPQIEPKARGRGSYSADLLMNPRNAQRQIDALAEAEKYPRLTNPMDSWYVMDPMFHEMAKLVGKEQAIKDYVRFNATTTPFSAGSDVLTEINRGTAANMMAVRGQYPKFAKYGGIAEDERGRGFPKELRDVKGHAFHSTAQAPAAQRWLETGSHDYTDDALKIYLYHLASGVPQTGFQTKYPVLDAHIARSSGAGDVRNVRALEENPTAAQLKSYKTSYREAGANMAGAEYRAFAPWYYENVAKPLGLQGVPAQGRQWGVFAPQTGVDTPIGAPKLELLSQAIWERAQRLGVDPMKLRDDVMLGRGHAVLPFMVGGGSVLGALAAPQSYTPEEGM